MKQNYEGNINRLYLVKQKGEYRQQSIIIEENVPLYRNIFGHWVRDDKKEVPTGKEEALDRAYDIVNQYPDIPDGELIGGYSYLDEGSIKRVAAKGKTLKKKIN